MRPFTRAEIREVDVWAAQELGISTLVLMENAGRGAAELLQRLAKPQRVVICCGHGNNGGDGFVMARHLRNAGVDAQVLLCGDPQRLSPDARVNYDILRHAGWEGLVCTPATDRSELRTILASGDWIVDALLGTGAQGPLREPFVSIIENIHASQRPVFAVDLPTGLDAETGIPDEHAVRATITATFVGPKIGFDHPAAASILGAVHILDIGIPRVLLEDRYPDF